MGSGPRGRTSALAVAAIVSTAGLFVALAVPQCGRIRDRSATGAVRRGLRALFARQLARHDLEHRYVAHPDELGFVPEDEDPYAYYFADPAPCAAPDAGAPDAGPCLRVVSKARSLAQPPRPLVAPAFIAGPDGRYLVTATANLDADEQLDSWSVASHPRRGGALSGLDTCAAGDTPAGEPCHDVDDLQR
jgi:hypothetical protein